jgi:prepilin-type N-terminal cleavage/methylation domain-containing protein
MRLQRAFTLIEMMAVILILGLVMSVVVVNAMNRVEWSKIQLTKVKNEQALDDAWKRRFQYEHPPVRRERGYDLWSWGRDGSEGGEGPDADIVSTE